MSPFDAVSLFAEIAVAQIVGEDALEKARTDPWIAEMLEADLSDIAEFTKGNWQMPKLLVSTNKMLHGLTASSEVLISAIEQEFGLLQSPSP